MKDDNVTAVLDMKNKHVLSKTRSQNHLFPALHQIQKGTMMWEVLSRRFDVRVDGALAEGSDKKQRSLQLIQW